MELRVPVARRRGRAYPSPVRKDRRGRPTDYSDRFLQAAEEYLEDFDTKGDVVPTIEALADELQKSVKTLYNWGEMQPEFQEVLDRLLAKQGAAFAEQRPEKRDRLPDHATAAVKGKPNACWYLGYKDEDGKQKTKKGFTDRKATKELADKLEREARLRREGLVDPVAEQLRDRRRAPIDRWLTSSRRR